MRFDELTTYLYEHIPLTRALGVVAQAWDGRTLSLRAPLEPNRNLRGTAFGGSLAALAIVCGWAALHLALGEGAGDLRLVIQRSTLDFQTPVEGEFSAVASVPDGDAWARFLRGLKRRGRARIAVPGDIRCDGRIAGRHEGVYAALPLAG
jgi:thioesterase domain-containing protein